MANKSNQVDRIFPMSHFRAEVAKAMKLVLGISGYDLDILLKYLARDKSAIFYDDQVDIVNVINVTS